MIPKLIVNCTNCKAEIEYEKYRIFAGLCGECYHIFDVRGTGGFYNDREAEKI